MSTPLYYRDHLIDRYRLVYDWVPEDAQRVLDIGCGNGVFSQWLRRKVPSVTATDHNPAQLAYGREHFPDVAFVQAEGEELPFEDAMFDAVVMTEVLEHMTDDAKAASECLRVLQPGGTAVITVPNRGPLALFDGDNTVNRIVWILSRLHIPRGRHPNGRRRTMYEGFAYVRHRHYSLGQLQGLFGDGCSLEKASYGGTMVWPITYLFEKLAEVFLRRPIVTSPHRILRRLRAADFRLSLGRCSYNLAARFRKA